MNEEFYSKELELRSLEEKRRKGEFKDDDKFEFEADLSSIPRHSMPSNLLEKQIFEHISLNGRTLSLTINLIESMERLNIAIDHRNKLIITFTSNPNITTEITVQWYFGRPDIKGNVDKNYSDSVDAIYSYVDDCIFYSMHLCEDLMNHGQNLKKAMNDKKIVINEAKYDAAEQIGLLPDKKKYEDWSSMFVQT